MTDIFTIFTYPASNNAFSNYHSPGATDRSDSPPRKTPRLSNDSDSASASRSRQTRSFTGNDNESTGPILLKITGVPVKVNVEQQYEQDFILVKRTIRVLFLRGNRDRLPATYDRIKEACRSVICSANKGDGVYENFKLELERCIGDLVKSLENEQKQGVDYIVPFIDACQWFEKQVSLLQSLLAWFDRKYLRNRTDLSGLRDECYKQFAVRVLDDPHIQRRVRTSIEAWVTYERNNGDAHTLRPYIPQLISRLAHHGRYELIFEYVYLKSAKDFYLEESKKMVQELDPAGYLRYVDRRSTEEENRSVAVLPESIVEKVNDTVWRSLLVGKLQWLVDHILPVYTKSKNTAALAGLFVMFSHVDGQEVFLAALKTYVITNVKAIVTDEEHDDMMVEKLLDFKQYIDELLQGPFADPSPVPVAGPLSTVNLNANRAGTSAEPMDIDALPPAKVPNRKWIDAVRDAFSTGFKARKNKPAEMIAKYLDQQMRKGQKGKADSVFQKELSDVLLLTRFTDDKDVFRTFYHKALSKRLLLEKSASDDFEKAMLKKLQEEYDSEFGMGDQMFKDLSLSKDLMREYQQQRVRNGESGNTRLNAVVLQRGFWPFSLKPSEAIIPNDMQSELTKYSTFYKVKHTGRKLDWEHSLGTAVLRARFAKGTKELRVSLYQTLVLLLFNEEDQLRYTDIKEQTHIEDGELRRTLQSLAVAKKRVLRKEPVGKEVRDNDIFTFNPEFWENAYSIHINTIQVKETPEESKKTQSLIESDRKHVLDAAIVRVMKAKKELHMEHLKTGIIDAVKSHFVPSVQLIKERIDAMVEGEYIKRSDADMNIFVYLA
ncbi:hypothetical protein QCA50_008382 [Cerrena zonata]|uniref:Cullin family profile domain-containing protein n=1 Tax=Cerrena zonata TaxID=2478898 RepID=A0AAW0G6I3_9APHY